MHIPKFRVETTYNCGGTLEFDLPDNLEWCDVRDWHVKWDTIVIEMNNGAKMEFPLDTDPLECIDWKRPVNSSIYVYGEFDPIAEA